MKYIIALSFVFFLACASSEKTSDKEELSFSIVSVNNINSNYSLVGSSLACTIKWDVAHGILTHRMNCPKASKNELWAYLLGMASKLKSEYKREIYYLRYTTKDFPVEEKKVASLLEKSKIWRRLNLVKLKRKSYQEFSNKFMSQVIQKKGVFSIVPQALNTMGYNFAFFDVDVKDFSQSKKRSSVQAKNMKVVYKKKDMR